MTEDRSCWEISKKIETVFFETPEISNGKNVDNFKAENDCQNDGHQQNYKNNIFSLSLRLLGRQKNMLAAFVE
jgi:hypothetical protein